MSAISAGYALDFERRDNNSAFLLEFVSGDRRAVGCRLPRLAGVLELRRRGDSLWYVL